MLQKSLHFAKFRATGTGRATMMYLKYFLCSSLARKYLKDLVKDLIRKRHEEKDKDEKLFIDALLECDFIDEETVSELTCVFPVLLPHS